MRMIVNECYHLNLVCERIQVLVNVRDLLIVISWEDFCRGCLSSCLAEMRQGEMLRSSASKPLPSHRVFPLGAKRHFPQNVYI